MSNRNPVFNANGEGKPDSSKSKTETITIADIEETHVDQIVDDVLQEYAWIDKCSYVISDLEEKLNLFVIEWNDNHSKTIKLNLEQIKTFLVTIHANSRAEFVDSLKNFNIPVGAAIQLWVIVENTLDTEEKEVECWPPLCSQFNYNDDEDDKYDEDDIYDGNHDIIQPFHSFWGIEYNKWDVNLSNVGDIYCQQLLSPIMDAMIIQYIFQQAFDAYYMLCMCFLENEFLNYVYATIYHEGKKRVFDNDPTDVSADSQVVIAANTPTIQHATRTNDPNSAIITYPIRDDGNGKTNNTTNNSADANDGNSNRNNINSNDGRDKGNHNNNNHNDDEKNRDDCPSSASNVSCNTCQNCLRLMNRITQLKQRLKQTTDEHKEQNIFIQQLSNSLRQKSIENEQQKIIIQGLSNSHQHVWQLPSMVPCRSNDTRKPKNSNNFIHADTCTTQDTKTNKRKKKKKGRQKPIHVDNRSSYNPPPHQIADNISSSISKQMSLNMVPSLMGRSNKVKWYNIMRKTNAMQCRDNPNIINNKNNLIVMNYDFCDEKKDESYYCIVRKDNASQQYKMQDNFFTALEIEHIGKRIKIPISSRKKLRSQLQHSSSIKNLLSKTYEKIIDQNWSYTPVFSRKHNQRQMVLRIQNGHMNKLMKNLKRDVLINPQLIPIIMFNNNRHWVEWIVIVTIVNSIDIGISLLYNEENVNNPVTITGIHLDKEYLMEQHSLVDVQHIAEGCRCFHNFTSCITNIEIRGDLNDDNNKIKSYKQQNDQFRAFVLQYIDLTPDNDRLKQQAILLIEGLNGSLGSGKTYQQSLMKQCSSVGSNSTLPSSSQSNTTASLMISPQNSGANFSGVSASQPNPIYNHSQTFASIPNVVGPNVVFNGFNTNANTSANNYNVNGYNSIFGNNSSRNYANNRWNQI